MLVGQWPRPNAILRITNVVVNIGAIIDSVKITYSTSSGSQTVTHGGPGGKEGLNFNLTGKFICFVFKICSPSELQQTKRSLLFMVAGSTVAPLMAVESVWPVAWVLLTQFHSN